MTLVDEGFAAAEEDSEQSYAFKLGGHSMITIYGLADATGADVDNLSVNLGTYLKLHITDTDSSTEGHLWYDASEHALKFYNGTAVKTIAVAA